MLGRDARHTSRPGDRVTDPLLPPLLVLADPAKLRDGGGARFRLRDFGIERDAFVIRFGGRLYAYVNACRHQSLPLDWGDAQFFDAAGTLLECRHHGARYRPETGACVDGPCDGGRLTPLALELRDGALWCLGRLTPPDG